MKCDWCNKPAKLWVRKVNYCGDCLGARRPENRRAQDWWPRVQQVGVMPRSSDDAGGQQLLSLDDGISTSGARAGACLRG